MNYKDLDTRDISSISRFAEKFSNRLHDVSNASTLDKNTTELINELVPCEAYDQSFLEYPFIFEIVPWIAVLAAHESDNHINKRLSARNRYNAIINSNSAILNLLPQNKKAFGYEIIHHSRAYHETNALINGSQHIGKSVLGEIVTSLGSEIPSSGSVKSSSLDQTLDSINILNTLLEQFSIVNFFNNISNTKELANLIENNFQSDDIAKLKYERTSPTNLTSEIKNLIQQTYDAHPFTITGMPIYFKPITPIKKVGFHEIPSTKANPKGHLPESIKKIAKIHGKFISSIGKATKSSKGISVGDPIPATNMASELVNEVCMEFNKTILKRLSMAVPTHNKCASLSDFISSSPSTQNLVTRLDDNPRQFSLVRQLFSELDHYLSLLMMPKVSSVPTFQTQLITNIIAKYDNSQHTPAEEREAVQQIRDILSQASNDIINFFQNFDNQLQDHNLNNPDQVRQTLNSLRTITQEFSTANSHSDDWNQIIENN